jgi:hypothetical protein
MSGANKNKFLKGKNSDHSSNGNGDSSQDGGTKEDLSGPFGELLTSADQLEGSAAPSEFAALNIKIHNMRLTSGDLSVPADSELLTGRCIIFAAGDTPFTSADTKTISDSHLSPGGRIVASKATDKKPEDCENFFKDLMPERFERDFLNLHVSIYTLNHSP